MKYILKKNLISLINLNYKKKDLNKHIKKNYQKDNYKIIENKNFIYFFKKNENKKNFLFCCHIDTADIEKKKQPFLKKKKVYGSGALDNLSGCAILIAIKDHVIKKNLNSNIEFLFLKKEEKFSTKLPKKVTLENKNVIMVDGTSSDRILHGSYFWKIFDVEIINEVDSTAFSNIHKIEESIDKIKNSIKILNNRLNKECKIYYLDISKKKIFLETVYFPNKFRFFCRSVNNISLSKVIKNLEKILKYNKIDFNIKILKNIDGFKNNKKNKLLAKFKSFLLKDKKKCIDKIGGYTPMRDFRTKNIFLYGPGHGKYPHSDKEFYDLNDGEIVLKNLTNFIELYE